MGTSLQLGVDSPGNWQPEEKLKFVSSFRCPRGSSFSSQETRKELRVQSISWELLN